MIKYLARRFVASALILLGVVTITFCLIYIFPADPVRQVAGHNATPETVASIRHEMGLDRPLPERYAIYVGRLFQGDLGRSYIQKSDVGELIRSRLPATLLLMLGAIFFELLIGIPLGILAAARRGKVDRGIMIMAFAGVSAPQFVVGLILLYVFAYVIGWFPLSGYGGLSHLILPALTLAPKPSSAPEIARPAPAVSSRMTTSRWSGSPSRRWPRRSGPWRPASSGCSRRRDAGRSRKSPSRSP